MRRALITGITGQDGSYLAELLLAKGYEVHGLYRRNSQGTLGNAQHLRDRVRLHYGDLLDGGSLRRAVRESMPDEVYNLAAQSFVGTAWEQPHLTASVTGLGALHVLDAVRDEAPHARFYQASSSEMFGNADESPQNEDTPFRPRSPYGVAKVFAHQIAVNYRQSYDMHVSCGILFNHESERRGREFVTRKICWHAAAIRLGLAADLRLGNMSVRRDWGYAPDYVEAMWLMLQQDQPADYVVATGVGHSVRDVVDVAFDHAGVWADDFLKIDPGLRRPADVHHLCGDASSARSILGWRPKTTFEDMIRQMVDADMRALSDYTVRA